MPLSRFLVCVKGTSRHASDSGGQVPCPTMTSPTHCWTNSKVMRRILYESYNQSSSHTHTRSRSRWAADIRHQHQPSSADRNTRVYRRVRRKERKNVPLRAEPPTISRLSTNQRMSGIECRRDLQLEKQFWGGGERRGMACWRCSLIMQSRWGW